MDQIGVVGLSYRHAGSATVGRYTVATADLPSRLPALRDALGVDELVYLATCNRVELWYATTRGEPPADLRERVYAALAGRAPTVGEARETFRAWLGEAAIEHLLVVTAGLDSAQAGEREIATQVRRAWHAARAAGTAGPLLDRLCADALRVGRRAHALATRPRAASIADLTVGRVLAHAALRGGKVALVGVSPMTRRCGRLLRERGVPLLVVNRSLDSARELAAELAAEVVPLETFRRAPPRVDALILAAGATEPVLDGDALAALATGRAGDDILIADLGVPANVDPEAAAGHGLARIGIDDLIDEARGTRTERLLELAPARALIDERLEALRGEAAVRAVGRDVAEFRDAFERIAAADIERFVARSPGAFDEAQAAELRGFALRLAHRLAHLPLRGIRAFAGQADPDAVARFFREARLHRSPTAPHSSRQGASRRDEDHR